MNQAKFMSQYVYALSSDFKAADGTPAKWAPNMPSYWGSESKHLKFDTTVSAFALSGDDSLLAIGVGKAIHIYGTKDWELRQALNVDYSEVSKLEFVLKTGTGYVLVSGGSNYERGTGPMIVMWELDDEGKDIKASASAQVDIEAVAKKASNLVLEDLKWSDESEVAKTLEVDFKKALTAATAAKGLESRTVLEGSFGSFGSQLFSPDGKYMITQSGNDNKPFVEIWDPETRTSIHKLSGHTDSIMWIRASPDSKMVASVAWDGFVKVWNLESGECLHTFGNFGGQMWAGVWSPDSKYLAFSQGSPETIVFVYNVEAGEQTSKFMGIKNWARSMDWSPDGKFLASGAEEGLVVVWDPMTGNEMMRWELKFDDNERMMKHFISTWCVKFVGPKLIFQTTEGTTEVYDFESNLKSQFTRKTEDELDSMVYASLEVSHNGKFLVSGDADKTVRIWDY